MVLQGAFRRIQVAARARQAPQREVETQPVALGAALVVGALCLEQLLDAACGQEVAIHDDLPIAFRGVAVEGESGAKNSLAEARGGGHIRRGTHETTGRRMATEERVLCFPRRLLEEVGAFQGLSLEVEKYLPVVTAPAQLRYLNRSEAEQDKRFKQLIPYVLLDLQWQDLALPPGPGRPGNAVARAVFRGSRGTCFGGGPWPVRKGSRLPGGHAAGDTRRGGGRGGARGRRGRDQ